MVFRYLCMVTSLLGIGFGLGCANLTVIAPLPQTFTPDVQGRKADGGGIGFKVEGGLQHYRQDTIASDASRRPLSLDPAAGSGSGLDLGTYLGLGERLEVGASVTSILSYAAAINYQWVGPSRAQDSDSGWVLASGMQGMWAGMRNRGDQDGVFGPGGHDWNAQADVFGYGLQVSGGYRWSPKSLLWLGVARVVYDVRANVFHDRSRDGSSPPTNYDLSGQGWGNTVTAAWTFGREIYSSLGVQYSTGSLPFSGFREDVFLFLRFGAGHPVGGTSPVLPQ